MLCPNIKISHKTLEKLETYKWWYQQGMKVFKKQDENTFLKLSKLMEFMEVLTAKVLKTEGTNNESREKWVKYS